MTYEYQRSWGGLGAARGVAAPARSRVSTQQAVRMADAYITVTNPRDFDIKVKLTTEGRFLDRKTLRPGESHTFTVRPRTPVSIEASVKWHYSWFLQPGSRKNVTVGTYGG